MATIQMYTTRWCAYCVRAKTLLESRGIEFEEISLDGDPAFRQRLHDLTGGWTVPQIVIDGTPIGGGPPPRGRRPGGRPPAPPAGPPGPPPARPPPPPAAGTPARSTLPPPARPA